MNLKDKKSKKIILSITTIMLIVIFASVFIMTQIGPYNKNNKEDIVIDIPSGSTLDNVTNILKENKLIKNKIYLLSFQVHSVEYKIYQAFE